MTMFERLMARLGFSRTEDLVLVGRNADYAFTKLAEVEPELEAAKDRLSFVAAENVRLRAEIKQMRLTPGEKQTLANHRLRVLREVADRVAA